MIQSQVHALRLELVGLVPAVVLAGTAPKVEEHAACANDSDMYGSKSRFSITQIGIIQDRFEARAAVRHIVARQRVCGTQ